MTNNNIVYLLGAGASAQALPLVSDFNDRLVLFQYVLSNAVKKGYREAGLLDKDLARLIQDEQNHYSIDTLAKKYWLADSNDEYNKIKALMTCFFTFEVFKKSELLLTDQEFEFNTKKITKESIDGNANTIDKRYDALLAAIAKKNPSLSIPHNISFISWNYDDQLEYAAWNLSNAGKEIKFFSPSPLIKPLLDSDPNKVGKENLIKLNGSFIPDIILLDGIGSKEFDIFFNHRKLNKENLNKIDKLYDKLLINPKAIMIQFAWEHSLVSDSRITLAKKKIEEATDLVIIGYSFPNYNIDIDQFILSKKRGHFKNIYIEDTINNFIPLIERLRYLNIDVDKLQKEKRIKHYLDLKTFCLPPSYFIEYPKIAAGIKKNSLI